MTFQSSWWVLEKGADAVRCRVEGDGGQAVICIEMVSRVWPLSIIYRCDEDSVADAVAMWRDVFQETGWNEVCGELVHHVPCPPSATH